MTPSFSNDSQSGLRNFNPALHAQRAQRISPAAKATPSSSNDPYGLERFERSHAQTLKGFRRLANAIKREATGFPLTRKQRAEQRPPKLDETEID